MSKGRSGHRFRVRYAGRGRGKSGLHRAGRRGNPGLSATAHARVPADRECHRKQTPSARLRGARGPRRPWHGGEGRVKRRGKSPPPGRQRAGHGKPRSEQSQAAGGCSPADRLSIGTLRVGCRSARETAAAERDGDPRQNPAYRSAPFSCPDGAPMIRGIRPLPGRLAAQAPSRARRRRDRRGPSSFSAPSRRCSASIALLFRPREARHTVAELSALWSEGSTTRSSPPPTRC